MKTFGFAPDDLAILNGAVEEISAQKTKLKKLSKSDREKEIDKINRSERFRIMDL